MCEKQLGTLEWSSVLLEVQREGAKPESLHFSQFKYHTVQISLT